MPGDEIPVGSTYEFLEPSADDRNLESIEAQLGRILGSKTFVGSARLKQFLEFTIKQQLEGQGDALKEYSIALEVFDKPATYDPSIDSTVRTAALRLRAKLRIYYETEGRNDPILVEYPGGHYLPRFSRRFREPEGQPQPPAQNANRMSAITTDEPTAAETELGPLQGTLGLGESCPSLAKGSQQKTRIEELPSPAPRRRPFITGVAMVGLIFLLIGAGIHYWRLLRTETTPSPPARPSVVVFGFQNFSSSKGSDWLSPALTEMFRAELSTSGAIRTISGMETFRAKIELDLRDIESLSHESLSRLNRNLGVDLVIVGSYVELGGGDIRLDIHLQNAVEGETIATISGRGTEDKLFDLVSRVGTELREKLGLKTITPVEFLGLRASLPSNETALAFYAEGVEKSRLFEAVKARELLAQAVAEDPTFPLSHSALAEAWSALGYDEKAKQEAKRATDLARDLPREQSWLIEGRYREMNKEWDKAVDIYKILWAFHPDVIDNGLRLVEVQIASGNGANALETVQELRNLAVSSSVTRGDPRIELAEASARESLSEYPQQLAAAEQAAKLASANAAWLVVARARISEGMALWRIGEMDRAIGAFDKAKTIFAGVSDKHGVASALNAIANVTSDRGDLITSKKMYLNSAAIYREIGDKRGLSTALNDLGILLKNTGDTKGARKLYDESAELSREIDDRRGEGRALFNTAYLLWNEPGPGPMPLYLRALAEFKSLGYKSGQRVVLHEMTIWSEDHGRLEEALTFCEMAMKLSGETGSNTERTAALDNRGTVLFHLGRLEESKLCFREALGIYVTSNRQLEEAGARISIAEVLYSLGDLQAARTEYQTAARLFEQHGKKEELARSLLYLAALDLEDGKSALVESSIRDALFMLKEQKSSAESMLLELALANFLLKRAKYREAQQATLRAKSINELVLKRDVGFDRGLEISLQLAREHAGMGDGARAVHELNALLMKARDHGYRAAELEARLTIGRIELRSGQRDIARRQLVVLADDARSLKFGLLAREAERAAMERAE